MSIEVNLRKKEPISVRVGFDRGEAKIEQEKTVDVTKNGTTEVFADEGKSMSKVTVNTNVAFEGDIGKPYIDTSMITDLSYFCQKNRINSQIDKINTSNSTDFTSMFYNCTALMSIPLIDTSKGIIFTSMFSGCKALTLIPLIDTSKGTDFSAMFYDCTALTDVTLTTASGKLTTSTFYNCSKLKNLTIGEGWAVDIYLHYSKKLTVESLHGMIENLADLTGQTSKTFRIGETNIAKIDSEHISMLEAKNWTYL